MLFVSKHIIKNYRLKHFYIFIVEIKTLLHLNVLSEYQVFNFAPCIAAAA